MTHNQYIIHIDDVNQDTNPSSPIPITASNLINRLRNFYQFMGVEDDELTVKYFRERAIVTGILYLSPSPKVSIDFSDRSRIKVDTFNVNIEPLFDHN